MKAQYDMKSTLLIVSAILLMLFLGVRFAQAQSWEWQNPLPTGNSLAAVEFTDANKGWAVGSVGTIIHTTNGGGNWSAQSSGTANDLYGVSFVDANNGWAVGSTGTILHTINGGGNWSAQNSGTTNWLFGVAFTDANLGWAVGYQGMILHTANGGSSWSVQSSSTTYDLHGIAFTDANQGWAVGAHGVRRQHLWDSWSSSISGGYGGVSVRRARSRQRRTVGPSDCT